MKEVRFLIAGFFLSLPLVMLASSAGYPIWGQVGLAVLGNCAVRATIWAAR